MEGYRRLLVPTDLSSHSTKGVLRAAEFARAFKAKALLVFVVEKTYFAPLSMVHQAPVTFRGEGDLLGEAVEYAETKLRETKERHFSGIETETRVAIAASAASGILEAAESWKPDLIVIASHGRSGVLHLLLGSTTEKVLRHAAAEVLVVRSNASA